MDRRDADHIIQIFHAQQPAMQRRVARIVGPANAPDVMQDGFLRIWDRAVDRITLTPAYLARCLRNAAIDYVRREHRQEALTAMLLPEQLGQVPADPADAVMAADDLRRLEAAIRALPERCRRIFLLNRHHGCSYQEIASVMTLSSSTVEREIARALMACRAALDDR